MNLPIMTPPDAAKLQNFFFPVFWGSADRETVTTLAKAITERVQPGFHFADNFLTWGRNNSMFEDLPFVKAWQSNTESDSDFAILAPLRPGLCCLPRRPSRGRLCRMRLLPRCRDQDGG